MKKILTLTVLVAAAAAMTFTACEKKAETPGEKLDQAIDNTNSGVNKFTKKAERPPKTPTTPSTRRSRTCRNKRSYSETLSAAGFRRGRLRSGGCCKT